MNSDLLVIVLSLTMLAGSFTIGLLPAMIKASNKFMNLISILGAGLLVGVALIIIIPEGMMTLNSALQAQHIGKYVALFNSELDIHEITELHMGSSDSIDKQVSMYLGSSLIFGFIIMLLIDQVFVIIKDRYGQIEDESGEYESLDYHEQLLKRTECKHMQNSVQSTRPKGCLRIKRSVSTKPTFLPRLSEDYTDQRLIGKFTMSGHVITLLFRCIRKCIYTSLT